MIKSNRQQAFTLIEALLVISIISLLASLMLPVFWIVQGKVRQTSCLSNMHQLGQSFTMYIQDYDGYYPYAVDPSDKSMPSDFSAYPSFALDIPNIGLIQDVLKPYVGSKKLFSCPADTGFQYKDYGGGKLDAFPSSYERYGTSYYYRTALAAEKRSESSVSLPAEINVLTDGVGIWHGTLVPLEPRYNVLFADGHAKNCSRAQLDIAWSLPLSSF